MARPMAIPTPPECGETKPTILYKRPDLVGNKFALGNNGGHPRLFKNVEELEQKASKYFEECKELNKPLTMAGLAYALGTCRKTLYNYRNIYGKNDEFVPFLSRLRAAVEADMESRALEGKNNATMSIFSLKNNFGWRDDRNFYVKQDAVINVVTKFPGPEIELPEDTEIAEVVEE